MGRWVGNELLGGINNSYNFVHSVFRSCPLVIRSLRINIFKLEPSILSDFSSKMESEVKRRNLDRFVLKADEVLTQQSLVVFFITSMDFKHTQ